MLEYMETRLCTTKTNQTRLSTTYDHYLIIEKKKKNQQKQKPKKKQNKRAAVFSWSTWECWFMQRNSVIAAPLWTNFSTPPLLALQNTHN